MATAEQQVRGLLNAAAVRERAHEMLDLAIAGEVDGWRVDLSRLDAAADITVQVTREQYPDLVIPFHARARHFVAGPPVLPEEPRSRGRAAFDLVILSVLLDAGSGPGWRFADPVTAQTYARSEGLAVASQRMIESGSLDGSGEALADLTPSALAEGFQVSAANPLLGLEGRVALLRRLGARVLDRPDLFPGGRLGGLFDVIAAQGSIAAPAILELLLEALGPVWTGRLELHGVPLGDCWRHPAIKRDDATDGLVPIHKLSQWLSYSLIEPLLESGVAVGEIDGLTGLAEYRNGGLFMDLGVLTLADPEDQGRPHDVSGPLIVAWRAMTIALLDRLAPLVRERLGVDASSFPLACMLEGGSWAAGRRLAAQQREGGGPPLNIISDGTVF